MASVVASRFGSVQEGTHYIWRKSFVWRCKTNRRETGKPCGQPEHSHSTVERKEQVGDIDGLPLPNAGSKREPPSQTHAVLPPLARPHHDAEMAQRLVFGLQASREPDLDLRCQFLRATSQ